MHRPVLVILAAVGLIVACEHASPSAQPTEAELSADHRVFRWIRHPVGFTTEIPFSFHNRLADTVYVVNCRANLDMTLEARTSGGWQWFWWTEREDCLTPPIVIAPGTLYRDTLEVFGAPPGSNMIPSVASLVLEGTYRLVWNGMVTNYREYDPVTRTFGDTIPLSFRTSDPFTIRAP
jgi:hypothetical protein